MRLAQKGPAALSIGIVAAMLTFGAADSNTPPRAVYIVQAATSATADAAVRAAGGDVVTPLPIINGVEAVLTNATMARLRAEPGLQLHADGRLTVAGKVLDTHYPELIGATTLQDSGIDGRGITIAVVDTGLWRMPATDKNSVDKRRILAQFDVTDTHLKPQELAKLKFDKNIDDDNGHGTHITTVMMSSDGRDSGRFNGIAPGANLVAVRAFGAEGTGRYSDVINAIGWVVAHRDEFQIRVLNLSMSAPVQSHYWEDPLDQAVMAAWRAGIVVVVSAGNSGPAPMTVGVPGNVPYVITVGAMTDNYTPDDPTDDRLAAFSAAGPTYEGFVKPEIVAPGGHMLGRMPGNGYIAKRFPQFMDDTNDKYFTMSGTSQSAAVVSGVVALMLQVDPDLTPDQVKCRLIATARSAALSDGAAAYSVFQQGAGLVSAVDAVYSGAEGCANRGLDVNADLAGINHFGGPANRDEDGQYFLTGLDGEVLGGNGYLWSDGRLWNNSLLWSDGRLWNNSYLWSDGRLWNNTYLWDLPHVTGTIQTASVSINAWVPQE
jgi:subtilisin family serine protease